MRPPFLPALLFLLLKDQTDGAVLTLDGTRRYSLKRAQAKQALHFPGAAQAVAEVGHYARTTAQAQTFANHHYNEIFSFILEVRSFPPLLPREPHARSVVREEVQH